MNEPSWDILEDYFQEVLEGRSLNSVLKALKKQGFQISEGTLRTRYKEWQAFKRAQKDFEKKINYLKGEIKKEIEDFKKKLESLNFQIESVKESMYENFSIAFGEYFEEFGIFGRYHENNPFINEIKDEIENTRNNLIDETWKLRGEIQNLKNELKQIKEDVKTLSQIVSCILTGVYNQGRLERTWDAIVEKGQLTQHLINRLNEIKRNP